MKLVRKFVFVNIGLIVISFGLFFYFTEAFKVLFNSKRLTDFIPSRNSWLEPASRFNKWMMTKKEQQLSEKRNILFWNIPFDSMIMPMEFALENMNIKNHSFVMDSKKCGNCFFSYNRHLISSADAVVFHAPDVVSDELPSPKLRKSDQLYVYWTQENVIHQYSGFNQFANYFNLTMTVRRSSNIYSPYATFAGVLKMLWYQQRGRDLMKEFAKIQGNRTFPLSLANELIEKATSKSIKIKSIPKHSSFHFAQLLQNKSRLIAWIVSNCFETVFAQSRMKFYRTLQLYGLKIDLYGKCGKELPFSRWDPVFFQFLSRFKFFLVMENAYHCKDYITEKLWFNALYSGAVPVIFGPHRDDIAAVLPPKSYIHVEDFENHRQLIKYLRYLDRNSTAYAEYLKWRTWVKFIDHNGEYQRPNPQMTTENVMEIDRLVANKLVVPSHMSFCALCRKVHEERLDTNMVDLNKWMLNERHECINNFNINLVPNQTT